MKQYLDLLQHVLTNGVRREDRTGTGTLSVFGYQMRFDLQEGLPVVTTKKVNYRAAIVETLWFLSGSTNVKDLHKYDTHIWDPWADEEGELGPVYGHLWRNFGAIRTLGTDAKVIKTYPGRDQISQVIAQIKADPYSRRHIVTAWDPMTVGAAALPPCHCFFQFYVSEGKLSCQLYQRSCDAFIGLPFNLVNYSIITHLIAKQCDLKVGELIWTGGDVHLYLNHLDQVKLQLSRYPYPIPQVHIKPGVASIFDYVPDDIQVLAYHSHPAIKAPVAV